MKCRTLRLGIVLVVAVWVLIFFAPIVPYWIHEVCTSPFCQLISPGGYDTGFNSLGLQFFRWGARLDTSFDFEYIPPTISIVPGEQLTAFGALIFILFPITIFIAVLLLPEEWRMISAGFTRLRRAK